MPKDPSVPSTALAELLARWRQRCLPPGAGVVVHGSETSVCCAELEAAMVAAGWEAPKEKPVKPGREK